MAENTWFQRWAACHGEAFAMTDVEVRAIASWEESLGGLYSEAELRHATRAILQQPKLLDFVKGKVLERHLMAIRQAIHDVRASSVRLTDIPGDIGTCTLCRGTGYVIVPNLVGIKDGEWVPSRKARAAPHYYTYAVLCSCALGRWKGGHQREQMMTLEQYEKCNPRWRVQMEHRQSEAKKTRDLGMQVRGEKFDAAPVVKRLLKRYGCVMEND